MRKLTRRTTLLQLGGAAVWPLAMRAQQQSVEPVIGYLDTRSLRPDAPQAIEFRRGLTEAGYVEGQNVAIEYRGADNQDARLPQLAEELVRRPVVVIFVTGSLGAVFAAKAATSTIPIVFAMSGDPVRYGLVTSLDRPRGNVTGMAFDTLEVAGKRLELLCEMVPEATTVAYLSSGPNFVTFEEESSNVLATARALGRKVVGFEARNDGEIERAFARFAGRGAEALLVSVTPPLNRNYAKILTLAARYNIPAIYPGHGWAAAGGLMSYSPDFADMFRQVAVHYVARILKGDKAADLPVQRSTNFKLATNLKTAKALGLLVPPSLLARADEVIE